VALTEYVSDAENLFADLIGHQALLYLNTDYVMSGEDKTYLAI